MRATHIVRPKPAISARRMAVRPDVSWPWRVARVAAIAAVIAGAVMWAYTSGSLQASDTEQTLARLNADLERQQGELAELRAKLAQSDRQLQIERAAAGDLAKQLKQLAFDNAALKEDVAFFQSLTKTDGSRETGISVNRLRLQPGAAPGEYRYRMLLVQNGQRKDFRGHLELSLDVQQDGRKVTLVLPSEKDRGTADYQLDFKFFQRVEGSFNVAPAGEVKSMQVRVFETGSRTPKLTQTVSVF